MGENTERREAENELAILYGELSSSRSREAALEASRDEWQQAASFEATERARLIHRVAALEASLTEVLRTGLNGGNNVRMAFISAGRKELSPELLAKAEASERAVQQARALLQTQTQGDG